MKLNWRQSSWICKNSSSVLTLAAVFLFVGFGYRISFRSFTDSLNPIETPLTIGNRDAPAEKDSLPPRTCDLFKGEWIPTPSGPVYTNESCSFMESHFNRMKNGRPDTGYLHWRWNPRSCELPKFDAKRFLELMRNKWWALIGDSISRNHMQSLLCILSVVEKPIELYRDEDGKSRKWNFPTYNLTISLIWSPFLVKAKISEDKHEVLTSEAKIHFDEFDPKWTRIYENLDYMIIATGKWFARPTIYYENGRILGCHICDQNRNLTEMGFEFAYQKALHKVMNFMSNSNHKGLIFFRTSTPDHFENGEWHNGGTCARTKPFKQGQLHLRLLNKILLDIELRELEKATKLAQRNGVKLRLLDFTNLTVSRPDGHPGPYRQFQPFARDANARVQNDCLHWCLPGPIDAWNDVIMQMLENEDRD